MVYVKASMLNRGKVQESILFRKPWTIGAKMRKESLPLLILVETKICSAY